MLKMNRRHLEANVQYILQHQYGDLKLFLTFNHVSSLDASMQIAVDFRYRYFP
jgi:hypothetical protein